MLFKQAAITPLTQAAAPDARHVIRVALTVLALAILLALVATLAGCALPQTQASYDKQTISIEFPDGAKKTLSIAELRKLPQHDLKASYLRTTGKREHYQMSGPLLKDVLAKAGANIGDYEDVSVEGSDGYYTLVSRDVIKATPDADLLLALKIDGKTKLNKSLAPAQLAVQGQLGPYWVKMVSKIVLYKQAQKKDIKTVWVFSNLTRQIKPSAYPYFGKKDQAINLTQVWPLLDSINAKSFFTMKSSDGYMRNESMQRVASDYYLKITGKDAPINVAPTIDPAFGVKNIAWCSTDSDAMVFPAQTARYLPATNVAGEKGVALDALLKEVGVTDVATKRFELVDVNGVAVTVDGSALDKIILTTKGTSYGLAFDASLGVAAPITNLLDIHEVK